MGREKKRETMRVLCTPWHHRRPLKEGPHWGKKPAKRALKPPPPLPSTGRGTLLPACPQIFTALNLQLSERTQDEAEMLTAEGWGACRIGGISQCTQLIMANCSEHFKDWSHLLCSSSLGHELFLSPAWVLCSRPVQLSNRATSGTLLPT